ncbi:hypothetical protein SV7mr_05490 [Stieleria bergensis]|uniref:Uncharacterized protein n=1 Tax=Stieleria bergensis TaxID=2528025 RepID=A0A517SPL8_9BACT|nr:hypothetical protein SV7mr_05490 [Planctomycetes bacterium SV_7m_r]
MYQTERLHDQALAYLLDELSSTERHAFELRLDQPEAADALQQASELVLKLSELPWDQPPAAEQKAHSTQNAPPPSKISPARTSRHWKRLITLAAAALIMTTLAVLAQQDDNQQANRSASQSAIGKARRQPTADIQWQLAMQLADPAVRWNQKDSVNELTSQTPQASEWPNSFNTATDDALADDSAESDSADESLDWMVLAVQAQLESGEQDES